MISYKHNNSNNNNNSRTVKVKRLNSFLFNIYRPATFIWGVDFKQRYQWITQKKSGQQIAHSLSLVFYILYALRYT
jgi:hypothetical protein